MKVHVLRQEQRLPIGVEAAWEFFSVPENVAALTPPDFGFRTVSGGDEAIHDGQIIVYEVRILPGCWVRWVTEIKEVDEGRSFVDDQRKGPFKFWQHRHLLEPIAGGVVVRDVVRYGLPLGLLGEIAHPGFVRRKMERVFQFRWEFLRGKFGGF